MSIFFEELYKNIFKKHAKDYETLNIISGYASAHFLKRVSKEFPHLKINLYIGMSQQGISFDNHEHFLALVNNYSNINVYYQVKGANTHIKALEFSNENSNATYVGSANFTENGFIENREVMTTIEGNICSQIQFQHSISLLCNTSNIADYIKFYFDDESDESIKVPTKANNISAEAEKIDDTTEQKIVDFNVRNQLLLKTNHFNDVLYLPIVPSPSVNQSWSSIGVNKLFSSHSNNPCLIRGNLASLDDFFPSQKTFQITTFDDYQISAYLGGKFNRELRFKNFDIYEYTKKLLKINMDRIITNHDLNKFGYQYYIFKKVEEDKFILSLAND
ncbi:phospholipase D family protein [Staphylococcus simulans]|uniref:phospholipase D family protein n=1 Tax=Staphylococcus simulans TaxID=1286 RepID=UPI000E68EA64|nr:phospholipase D family protein [Staphylococcus simulans]RIN55581.1 NgoFVII family restriction endonuclease [Staphylococcus simulans]